MYKTKDNLENSTNCVKIAKSVKVVRLFTKPCCFKNSGLHKCEKEGIQKLWRSKEEVKWNDNLIRQGDLQI